MIRPRRYFVRIVLFLVAVAAAVATIFLPVRDAFLTNPALNGLILAVLIIGVIFNFRQVLMIGPEIDWLDRFSSNQPLTSSDTPRLLAPMARMLGENRRSLALSPLASRSLLDGIESRLEEARDISRYLIGLSIFLGLLGTFWGLLDTVNAIGQVISNLTINGGEISTVFDDLKRGLEAPMSGMGTAFSSSLFGLSGSLVLGFLDLQAGQAQNHFFTQLEDWLAGQTRVTSAAASSEGDQAVPAYIQALLEQTADSMNQLQRTMVIGEKNRAETAQHLRTMGDNLTTLLDQMRTDQNLMLKMAESQAALRPVLEQLARAQQNDAALGHIRNMDATLTHLVKDGADGRDRVVQELRAEIKLLARTIAATADRK